MFSLGQLFMMGIQGKDINTEEEKFIKENSIGGVILFTRNYESPEQLFDLCQRLQGLANEQPLFIGVDMEGGRVQRLKAPYTQWPALKKVGEKNSPSLAFSFAQSMGFELAATGINLNFAPCLDVLTNEKNTVIGDRALGSDHEMVAKLSSALVRGYIKSDIIPCAKHFPGHGNTFVDSHEDLPREQTTKETLLSREFEVFKRAIRARLNMVMTSHILFEQVDDEYPVTFSKTFLQDHLRGDLKFRGVIVTDDLDMGALSKHYSTEDTPVHALRAGCDLLLYCNNPESPQLAYEAVRKAITDKQVSLDRLVECHQRVTGLKAGIKKQELTKEALQSILRKADHQKIVEEVLAAS